MIELFLMGITKQTVCQVNSKSQGTCLFNVGVYMSSARFFA